MPSRQVFNDETAKLLGIGAIAVDESALQRDIITKAATKNATGISSAASLACIAALKKRTDEDLISAHSRAVLSYLPGVTHPRGVKQTTVGDADVDRLRMKQQLLARLIKLRAADSAISGKSAGSQPGKAAVATVLNSLGRDTETSAALAGPTVSSASTRMPEAVPDSIERMAPITPRRLTHLRVMSNASPVHSESHASPTHVPEKDAVCPRCNITLYGGIAEAQRHIDGCRVAVPRKRSRMATSGGPDSTAQHSVTGAVVVSAKRKRSAVVETDLYGGDVDIDDNAESDADSFDEEAGLRSQRTGKVRLSRKQKETLVLDDDWDDKLYRARLQAVAEGDSYAEEDLPLEGGLVVPGRITRSLFPYQLSSVKWMWKLHQQKVGGILGDEMGLGKTAQVAGFFGALKYSGMLKPSLVVCPATVISHWLRELTSWHPQLRVLVLHESSTAARASRASKQDVVRSLLARGDVLITTYDGLRSAGTLLLQPRWGYVVLDEGHKIRNPDAAITQIAKQLHTVHRLILTGAPIQNRLKELWSLFDFVYPGRLGTLPVFESQFTGPIAAGGWSHATSMQVETAVQCAIVLRDLIAPYLLRRLKKDVASALPPKTEQVLFCRLSAVQREIYKAFIRSKEVLSILQGQTSAFRAVGILRKICNHPQLLDDEDLEGVTSLLNRASTPDASTAFSGKLLVMREVLRMWKEGRHRALVFCQGRQMLDILEDFVTKCGYNYLRMDGTTPVKDRQVLVDTFNDSPRIFLFLLTTRVGGVGINLIGADRVLIFDPDWNPSTDIQARERAWRLGQTKPVTIYRLITAGTIEEKIYHRQIFKTVLQQRVLVDPAAQKLFNYRDLRELFSLNEPASTGPSAETETQQMHPEGALEGTDEEGELGKLIVDTKEYHDPDAQVSSKPPAPSNEATAGGSRETTKDSSRSQTSVLQAIFRQTTPGLAGAFSHDIVEGHVSGSTSAARMHAARVASTALKVLNQTVPKKLRTVPAVDAVETDASNNEVNLQLRQPREFHPGFDPMKKFGRFNQPRLCILSESGLQLSYTAKPYPLGVWRQHGIRNPHIGRGFLPQTTLDLHAALEVPSDVASFQPGGGAHAHSRQSVVLVRPTTKRSAFLGHSTGIKAIFGADFTSHGVNSLGEEIVDRSQGAPHSSELLARMATRAGASLVSSSSHPPSTIMSTRLGRLLPNRNFEPATSLGGVDPSASRRSMLNHRG